MLSADEIKLLKAYDSLIPAGPWDGSSRHPKWGDPDEPCHVAHVTEPTHGEEICTIFYGCGDDGKDTARIARAIAAMRNALPELIRCYEHNHVITEARNA